MTSAPIAERRRWLLELIILGGLIGLAVLLRFWDIDQFGVRGDETIYSGQASTLAGNPERMQYFAVFRAHPLVYQATLGLLYMFGFPDEAARWYVAAWGIVGVVVVWALARRLAGPVAGLTAAGVMALVPYMVINSRMALLDLPTGVLMTIAVYCLVRYIDSPRWAWLVSGAVTLALACLTKEITGVVLGALLLTQVWKPLRIGLRPFLVFAATWFAVALTYPASLIAGRGIESFIAYLRWQLGGRGQIAWDAYLGLITPYVGWLAVGLFFVGLIAIIIRREPRHVLVATVTMVVLAVLQAWKLREFQLPAVAFPLTTVIIGVGIVALIGGAQYLARRFLHVTDGRRLGLVGGVVLVVVVLALLPPMAVASWGTIRQVPDITLSAGRGGYPGQREAAQWLRENTPPGSVCLTPAASLGALIQFYADRSCYGANVNSDPGRRNPADVYVDDAEAWIRDGRIQYVILDVISDQRAAAISRGLESLILQNHGRLVHEERGIVRSGAGEPFESWLVRIYAVRG